MPFIQIGPGYILPQALEKIEIDEHLVDKDSLKESLSEDITNQIPADASIEELIEWVNNSDATEADMPNNRTGFSMAVQVKHDFELHIAARDGNAAKLLQLIQNGKNVNSEDERSARPLHYAAFNGKIAAMALLVKHGADVNDKAYHGNTALHFALKNHHYDAAILLVTQGKANVHACNNKGEDPISYLLSDLHKEAHTTNNQSLEKIDQILKTLSVMLAHCTEGYVSIDEFTKHQGERYNAPMPIETTLLLTAAKAPNQEIQTRIMQTVDEIRGHDTSHQSYLHALNLLHRFPTGEMYKLTLNEDGPVYLASEGHFGLFTTELARDSLKAFVASLTHPENALQKEVFSELHSIYQHAATYCAHANQPQTYSDALACYHKGETVLLPSGWRGHFVDAILSKQQETYASANSGDRYSGEFPEQGQERTEVGDKAGIIFYQLQEPEKVDENYIKNTLNNTSQMNLEFEQPMKYGMLKKLFEINNPDQEFGNCGWESHRDAVEGMLVIELLNRHIPLEKAQPLAKEYYESWDLFHGHYVIDQYMAHHPGLEIKALLDVLGSLHQKGSEKDQAHAQKIVDTLKSDLYADQFKEVVKSVAADPEAKEILHAFEEYHVDVKGIVGEVGQVAQDQNHVDPAPLPQFNIAHQLMTEAAIMHEVVLV